MIYRMRYEATCSPRPSLIEPSKAAAESSAVHRFKATTILASLPERR